MTPFTITLNDPLREFVLPVSAALGSAGLEILVIKEEMLPLRDTEKFSLNYKLWLPLGNFRLFMPHDKQSRGGVPILAGVTDPDQ